MFQVYEARYRNIGFSGFEATDHMSMPFAEWHRQTIVDQSFFIITDATANFTTMFDGFVGLAPYSNKDPTHYDYNFMYKLKKDGRISHNVAAIYTDLDPKAGGTPMMVVKFGGWDSFALGPNEKLNVHRTSINTQWTWRTIDHKYFGNTPVSLNVGEKFIQINPSVPYIYMPPHDMYAVYSQIY